MCSTKSHRVCWSISGSVAQTWIMLSSLQSLCTVVPIHCLMAVNVDEGMAAVNLRVLGMKFKRDRATQELWISQVEYISYILVEYDFTDCNPVHTLIDPLYPWGQPTDNLDVYAEMSN